MRSLLIARAEIDGRENDVRVAGSRIEAVGRLRARPGERVLDARGGALVPGLHDHHLHLRACAAARASVPCGPPAVADARGLCEAIRARVAGDTWVRGVGYHESVAGELDRLALDRICADVPIRVQHRSGRLWMLNSAAIAALRQIDVRAARTIPADGRWYDADERLATLLGATPAPIGPVSRQLAACGVTGITDMTPRNNRDSVAAFARLQTGGELLQRMRVAGDDSLAGIEGAQCIRPGARKFHLHDTALPPFAHLCASIRASHAAGREIAVHCVTEVELVYTLAALREAGVHPGDRIEHASVVTRALIDQLRELGLLIVTQPNFVKERGDAYRVDIPAAQHNDLYRAASLDEAGLALAAGTDAPFGDPDPWRAMRAAVDRTTEGGALLGGGERLSPERALALFTGSLESPGIPRRIASGELADLCLLCEPWAVARRRLDRELVRVTVRAGESIFERVDEPPFERALG
jgi:predicted amidohydrolase YtcJ